MKTGNNINKKKKKKNNKSNYFHFKSLFFNQYKIGILINFCY